MIFLPYLLTTFELLISKPNQFIFVSRCTPTSLVKIRTYARTDDMKTWYLRHCLLLVGRQANNRMYVNPQHDGHPPRGLPCMTDTKILTIIIQIQSMHILAGISYKAECMFSWGVHLTLKFMLQTRDTARLHILICINIMKHTICSMVVMSYAKCLLFCRAYRTSAY